MNVSGGGVCIAGGATRGGKPSRASVGEYIGDLFPTFFGFVIGMAVGIFGMAGASYYLAGGKRILEGDEIILREDLNQDGLPDASFRNGYGEQTPLYFVIGEDGKKYVTAGKIKGLYPERQTNYSEIERRLNEK